MDRRAFLSHFLACFVGFGLGLRRKEIVVVTNPATDPCIEPRPESSMNYWIKDQPVWTGTYKTNRNRSGNV